MDKITKKCKCGKVLVATSISQMRYNLNLHLKSKGHKEAMKLNKD